MRKTKSEGKTVGISQSVRKVANFAMQLRNWQGCCENSQCEISQCEIGKAVAKIRNAKIRNAKLARLLRKFAMRKFAMRNWNWHCEIEVGIAKLAFGIAKLTLRNFRIANLVCELIVNFAMRNFA